MSENRRGIMACAGYVPFNRLQRSAIADAMGLPPTAGGTRSVASYDEDTTTMGVEASRLALKSLPEETAVDQLWFSTAEPAYAEKTNATTIATTCRLDQTVGAFDFGGAARSSIGALRAALTGGSVVLAVSADIRTGLPSGADESQGGDAAAALVIGNESDGLVLAQYLGGASASDEFLDRWRSPGDDRTKVWAERFSEGQYKTLVDRAWNDALKAAAVRPDDIDRLILTGVHSRAVRSAGRKLGVDKDAIADDLSRSLGNSGGAQPELLLVKAIEESGPGQTIAVVMLADGADVLIFRTTEAVGQYEPVRSITSQIATGDDELPYAKFLSWRGQLTPEPPRRPEPDRVSGSAAGRSKEWKFGFVASEDRESETIHMPPARVSMKGGNIDDMEPVAMADVPATIVTLTVDRVSYSQNPPIVAAIVDFDGGGRMPCELTDCTVDDAKIGDRVEMTFRRLHSSDGIHNYFWKARPVRVDSQSPGSGEEG